MSSRLALFALVMGMALPVHADPPALPTGFGDCGRENVPERVLTCQGRAFLRAGRLDIALAKGRLSLSQQPTLEARNLIGDALRLMGHCKEARVQYMVVLRSVVDDATAQAGLTACAQPPPPRVSWADLLVLEGTAWAGPVEHRDTAPRAQPAAAPWPAWLVFVALVGVLVGLALLLWGICRRDRRAQAQHRANLLLWWVSGALLAMGCGAMQTAIELCGALTCPGQTLPEPRPGDPVASRVSPGVWDVTWIYPGAHTDIAEALAAQQGPRIAKQYGCPLFTSALQGAEQHAEKKSEGAGVHVHGSGEDPDSKVEPPPTITEVTVRLTCLYAPVPVVGLPLPAPEVRDGGS